MTEKIGKIVITIDLPMLTDKEYLSCMLSHINKVVKRETGVKAEINCYR